MSIIVDNNTPIFTGLSSISTSNVIFSGGNVGIGTTSPLHKLQVTQAADINFPVLGTGKGALFIAGDTNLYGMYLGINTSTGDGFIQNMRNNTATAYNLILNSAGGKVGIGTTSPSSTLSVGGNPPAAGAIGAVGASGGISLALSDNVNSSLYVKHAAAGVATLGTDAGGSLAFAINGYTEAIRINSSGLVGIGTTGPNVKLHVYENTDDWAVRIQNISTGSSAAKGVAIQAGDSALTTPMIMQLRDKDANAKVTFLSQGNVGIGTTSPAETMEISGGKLKITSSGYGWIYANDTNHSIIMRGDRDGAAANYTNYYQYGGTLANGAGHKFWTGGVLASQTLKMQIADDGTYIAGPLLPTGGIIGSTINYTTSQGWAAANPSSSQIGYFGGDFTDNGSTSENKTTYAVTPYLSPGLTWASINDVGNDGDGGWNKGITGLVSTKTYRSMVWVRRTNASTNGNFYLGCDGGNTLNLSNVVDTNPYFFSTGISTFTTTNRWYLAVGYIHAYGDGSTTSYSKIYDSVTGQSILTGTDYKMVNGATAQIHRTYFYYSTDTNSNLEWWGPRFEEVNGNEPTIGAMLAGSITTPTYSGGVSAPIYYDSDNTAFYGDFASTTNINALAGNGKTALETADTYLRINQSSAFSAGVWFGTSNRLSSTGYGAWGSDGGTTTSRVWILGGTYNGSNVISLNGSTGDITSAAIIYALTSSRSPIFYDYNDTTYYVDPNSTSSMWNVNIRGDLSAAGTANQVFFYGVGSTTTSAIGFKNGGQFASPTGNGDGWNTYLSMDTAGRGWVFRQATGGTDFTSVNNSGWILNNGIWQSNGSMRAPIFYDSNDTNYYCDPASTSRLNQINYTAMYNAADTNYGIVGNNAFFDTVNSGSAGDQLELCYSRGTFTSSSGSMRTPIFYDRDDTSYYGDFNSESRFNTFRTAGQALIGGSFANNSYNSVASTRLLFGGGDDPNSYFIGTNKENYGGDYTKLDLRWHTGIRMGARPNYGGVRFYDNETLGTLIFAIGKDGSYGQAIQSMRAPIFYDLDNTGYYTDPASTSNINQLNLAGSINALGNASYQYYFAHGNNSRLVLPAGNNGAGNGQAVLNMWISEPGVTWTASGIARNRTNDGGAGGFGRINTNLSSQMIRFDEGNSILFYTGNTAGTFWQPFFCTDDYAYSNASLRAPIFYDTNNTGYYGDFASTSKFNTVQIDYINQNVNFQGQIIYDVNQIHASILYHRNNTGYYVQPASTSNISTLYINNGWTYVANNYGYGVVGLYASTIFQLVFAMGDSYKTGAGGAISNLYGMAWSYPSAGGIAGNLDSHGMIVAINGGFGSCMSYSIVAAGNVTAYSDERLKTNWSAMPENFVERLAKVRVGTYDRIDGERIRQVGVSAQSLRPLLPEAVIEATDDFRTLSVSYGNAAMASAVELAKEVVSLKEQMVVLMDRLNKLENK